MKYVKDPEKPAQYLDRLADLSPNLVFPYRPETLKVLEWAIEKNSNWQLRYFLALNHWALGHQKEALKILNQFAEKIHFAPLYLARADLKEKMEEDGLADLEHALLIDKNNWRAWDELLNYYERHQMQSKLTIAAEEAYERLPGNYVIEVHYARSLIGNGLYLAAVDLLEGMHILPYEGASLGRKLWEEANLASGIDFIKKGEYKKSIDLLMNAQKWSENLGVGKPYDPDDRISDFLLAYAYQKLHKMDLVKSHQQSVLDSENSNDLGGNLTDLINIKLEKSNGRSIAIPHSNGLGQRSTITHYLEAYQNDDQGQMRTIETQNPELFSNLTFEIIKAAIELP
ncbi:MAG: hypothetical protein IPL46_28940 [Saprospiraceae bacterium]|nr:hypothetical protein [Saprospiraceae bacterium]